MNWGFFMSKKKEIFALFIADFCALIVANMALYYLQRQAIYTFTDLKNDPYELYLVSALMVFWICIFLFAGLYRSWYRFSFLDEMLLVIKSVGFGSVFLLLLTTIEFVRTHPVTPTKLIVFLYILLLISLMSIGRMIVRYINKKLLIHGIGRRNAVIIGWNAYAHTICKQIRESPHYGYDIVGFVKTQSDSESSVRFSPDKLAQDEFMYLSTYRRVQEELKSLEESHFSPEFSEEKDVIGTLNELPDIIRKRHISEIIIILDPSEHKLLLNIITQCDQVSEEIGRVLNLKIIPDLYTIISGQARTNKIDGIPLIELEPEIMPLWEQNMKRLIDVVVSLMVLIFFIPLWIAVALAIKLTSKGPVFYRQERIGRHGKPFRIIKFRSMRVDAEAQTGPMLAQKNDPRVTPVGAFLRKSRIDEFPQFINVLKGDMSIVGPRPEREYFIKQVIKKAPQFVHLHRVRPGITSLGQVKYGYAGTIDEIIERMKYDILYIENMSLRMDFKIIFYTIYVMLMGRGR